MELRMRNRITITIDESEIVGSVLDYDHGKWAVMLKDGSTFIYYFDANCFYLS